MAEPAADSKSANLPLFYRKPTALNPQAHGGLSLKRQVAYRYAARSNAIPLTTDEFSLCQRDYPIVFTTDDVPMPVAIVGLQDDLNLFIEANGTWRKGTYIPDYIRRYPFIFAENPGSKDLTLYIDEGSELVETSQANPFFRNGQPTEITKTALNTCLAYHRNYEATREFGRVLRQAELLVARDPELRPNPRRPRETVLLRGFRIIDEAKFNQLPAETFLDWRQKGWIALIYAHLLSLGSCDRLIFLATEQRKTKAR